MALDRPSEPPLKDQGNAAFRASDWPLSVTLYTAALSSLTTLTSEGAAALFSNRAAAYIHLFQFDRGERWAPLVLAGRNHGESTRLTLISLVALLDTAAAIALSPEWATGHARRAEVYARLHDFPAAISACLFLSAQRMSHED